MLLDYLSYGVIESGDDPNVLGILPKDSVQGGLLVSRGSNHIWTWDTDLGTPEWVLTVGFTNTNLATDDLNPLADRTVTIEAANFLSFLVNGGDPLLEMNAFTGMVGIGVKPTLATLHLKSRTDATDHLYLEDQTGNRELILNEDGLRLYDDDSKTYGIGFQLGQGNSGDDFSGGAGRELGKSNTGNKFSGGAGYQLGWLNTGADFSGGAGYQLGHQNSGDSFSGGAGHRLGYQNSGDDFSGGAGYQLGYQNTGIQFSGGAGYQLGLLNSGLNFAGGAGYQLGYFNTGNYFSGGVGYQLGFENTGNQFSGGAGYQLGYNNISTNFSGGAGYQLGFENTGSSFSGGAGYQLGYQNTGIQFSGGAGYRLGKENTGSRFSGGAGLGLGENNTGDSFSGGAGYQLGQDNTGTDFSGGAGYQLGYNNSGIQFSGGAGWQLGYQNTGTNFSGGAGYRLGSTNTGSNFSGGAGRDLGFTNTGNNFSAGAGYQAGYENIGHNLSIGAGYQAGYRNSGDDCVVIGNLALTDNQEDKNTALGALSFTNFVDDTPNIENITDAQIDTVLNKITGVGALITAKSWSIGDRIKLYWDTSGGTFGTTPNAASFQFFDVISATEIEAPSISFAGVFSGNFTLMPRELYTNCTAVGYDAEPFTSNQVQLGDKNTVIVSSTGVYNFQDTYPNDGTGVFPGSTFKGVDGNIYYKSDLGVVTRLNLGGSNFTQINSIYTILLTDLIIEATANTFTTTLPTAVGITGQQFIIKNSGAGVLTIDGDGTETIDGDLTVALSQYESTTVSSNGTNWIII